MPAKLRVESTISMHHKPGELARVLGALAKGGVNVLAFCGWGHGGDAELLVVPDDEEKMRRALIAAGISASEHPVVCVTTASGKGAALKLAAKLGKAGVNVQHAYATTGGRGQSTAVFRVPDPSAALKALK